jgi:hypothetical protein
MKLALLVRHYFYFQIMVAGQCVSETSRFKMRYKVENKLYSSSDNLPEKEIELPFSWER